MSANGTLFSTTELDFEAGHKSFYLLVGVRDSGGLEASTVLQVTIVNINDEIPHFTSPRREYSIPEEVRPGTIVANITAEDPDDEGLPGHLLYSITTTSSYLVIDQLTGTIQVAHRLDRDAGELRKNPIISLEVLVRDRPSGGQENCIQITFTVEDINDNPATCRKLTFRPSLDCVFSLFIVIRGISPYRMGSAQSVCALELDLGPTASGLILSQSQHRHLY
ncbi:cadherin-related family member 3 [Cricetulus griseus]|uniref:Cadherin-related family member 3 n=1 Tax=Cricetulus griseus TaxID=10029 RepID=A0A061I096_CRIGR|nr:cadherin-related family member 3 [Cricetulus griseus]